MLAERKNKTAPPSARPLPVIALYDDEAAANEWLDRLAALSVDTSAATLLRVAVNEKGARLGSVAHLLRASARGPATTREAAKGALAGGALALLAGLALYYFQFLNLTFLEGMATHTLAMMLVGAVVGAAVGALTASARRDALPPLPPPEAEGFMVFVKTPPRLAAQAETIARQLGAKQIIL